MALLRYSGGLAKRTGWRGTGIVSTLLLLLLLFAVFLFSLPFVFDGGALEWYLVRFTAKHKCGCDDLHGRPEVVIRPRAALCAYFLLRAKFTSGLFFGGFFFPSLLHLCSVHHSSSASSNLMHLLLPISRLWTAHSGQAGEKNLLQLRVSEEYIFPEKPPTGVLVCAPC